MTSLTQNNVNGCVADKSEKEEEDESLFNDILEESGCWSILNVWVFIAMGSVVAQQAGLFIWPVFGAQHISHQCNLPGLQSEHFENISHTIIRDVFYNDPNDNGCQLVKDDRGCSALNVNPTELVEESVNRNVTLEEFLLNINQSEIVSNAQYRSCNGIGHGYVFTPEGVTQDSVVSEFNLVCDREKWLRYEKTLFVLGQFLGLLFVAPLVDIFGRRTILLWLLFLQFFALLGVALSVNVQMMLVTRFFMSLLKQPMYSIVVTYGCEIVPLKYRTLYGLMPGFMFGLGIVLFACLGYIIVTWRIFTAASMLFAIPNFIMWFFLPESPRWLIQQRQNKKFVASVKFMEKVNMMKFSDGIWKRIGQIPVKQTKKEGMFKEKLTSLSDYFQSMVGMGPPGAVSFVDLLRDPLLRKWVFYFSVNWVAVMLLYYSLTFGAELFNINAHTYALINGVAEGPGAITACIGVMLIGRPKSQALCLIMCVVTVAGTVFLQDFKTIVLVCACLSRYFSTAAFGIVYIYTGETMPTLLRNTGICFCSAVCRLFGMLYPYIGLLNAYWVGASASILSILSLVAAFLCFLLPETNNQQLPDTVHDCYLLAKGKLKPNSKFTDQTSKEGLDGDKVSLEKTADCSV